MKNLFFFHQSFLLTCLMLLMPMQIWAVNEILLKPMPTTVVDYSQLHVTQETELFKYSCVGLAKAPTDYTPSIMALQLHNKGKEGDRYMSVQGDEIWNRGSRDFEGLIKLAVADADGTILQIFGEDFIASMPGGKYYIYPQTISGDLPDQFGDGSYRLYLVAQQTGYNDWSKVTQYIEEDGTVVQTGVECYINFWIVNNEVTYMSPYDEYYPTLMTTNIEDCSNLSTNVITVSVDEIMNLAERDFYGYISLAIADEEGSIISVFGDPSDATSGLPQYYFYTNPRYLVGSLPDMTDGVYRLYVVARQEGYAQWAKLQKYVLEDNSIVSKGKEYFLTYEISNGILSYLPEVLVQSISLGESPITLYKGETTTLFATVLPENATNKAVTWKSSNSTVATVDQNGVITAKKKGTARITASAQDESGVSGYVNITVQNITATGVELNYSSYNLKKGETVQLVATVTPENVENSSVAWQSSDISIASVSANGLVTAKGVGTAIITVQTKDGSNLKAECEIKVDPTLVTSVNLSETSIQMECGESYQLEASVLPYDATNKSLIWESSDTNVATVDDNGKVHAEWIGDADITASTIDGSGISATVHVQVIETPVHSIELPKFDTPIIVGSEIDIEAIIYPHYSYCHDLVWASDNENVLIWDNDSYDNHGIFKAIAPGEATITITEKRSGISASTTITVVELVSVSDISLNYTEYYLHLNGEVQLIATVSPENANDQSVKWGSTNERVAKVDQNGKVKAVDYGSATIYAKAQDGSGVTAYASVSVVSTITAQSLELNYDSYTLGKGEKLQLVASIFPENVDNSSLGWKSDNNNVATVSTNGLVTAKSIGTTTISVKTKDGSDLMAKCEITVSPTMVSSIELSDTHIEIEAGDNYQLFATVLPETATNKEVSWKSSDESIVTVSSSGTVHGLSLGEATIVVTATDGSGVQAEATVKVKETMVSSIELSDTYIEIEQGGNYQLFATVLPEKATNKEVIWESSDENIVMVSSLGVVYGLSLGEVTITVTAADGSGVKAEATVKVKETMVSSIELSDTYIEIEQGDNYQLYATVLPVTAANKEVIWESSDENIAIVTSSGLVYGLSIGEATIVATAADGSGVKAEAKVKVKEVLVSSITLNYTTYSLDKNESIVLEATVLPDYATNKKLSWKSSNEQAVLVGNTGKVIWVGEGEATVTATSTDGSNVSASCVFSCINGIRTITVDKSSSVRIYTVDGKQVGVLQKGVNIIRNADGTTEKVLIQ